MPRMALYVPLASNQMQVAGGIQRIEGKGRESPRGAGERIGGPLTMVDG
jgi:hypothetical protein